MHDLNEAQRRCLTAGLQALDLTCGEIERLLQGSEASVLRKFSDDLPHAARADVAAQVEATRRQIADFVHVWQLEPTTLSLRQRIIALLGRDWAALEDCRPPALQRYGPVEAEAAARLQPMLDDLIATVDQIMARVSDSHRDDSQYEG